MTLNSLNAISPLDGRYREQISTLALYFSEEALMKYRLLVEVEYFIALWEIPLPPLEKKTKPDFEKLRDIYRKFSASDAIEIKKIEFLGKAKKNNNLQNKKDIIKHVNFSIINHFHQPAIHVESNGL